MPDPSSPFSGSQNFVYQSSDLEAMKEARNYYSWILKNFSPYRGKNILEIGAGIGTFGSLVIEQWGNDIQRYIALEPDVELYKQLVQWTEGISFPDVCCLNGFLYEKRGEVEKIPEIDTILYVNVLEHIENDIGELRRAEQLLKRGGHILTYSPARPELFSELDAKLGHYRRYTSKEIQNKMERAGFEIRQLYYMDFPGFFFWFLKHRLFKYTTIKSAQVRLFDRLVVPVLAHLEPSRILPFGKNILAVGRKP